MVQDGVPEIRPGQHGIGQLRLGKIGAAGANLRGIRRLRPQGSAGGKLSAVHLGKGTLAKIGTAKAGSLHLRAAQAGASEVGFRQIRAVQIRQAQIGPEQIGAGEPRIAQLRTAKIGARQIGAGKIASAEIDAREIMTGERGRAAARTAANVKLVQLQHLAELLRRKALVVRARISGIFERHVSIIGPNRYELLNWRGALEFLARPRPSPRRRRHAHCGVGPGRRPQG
ncbi:MAG TPA: hypothetical protein VMA53_09115 [Stellaceae bacterium]|nr:hypothetical protein [Stellaceae bacterium]